MLLGGSDNGTRHDVDTGDSELKIDVNGGVENSFGSGLIPGIVY